MTDKGAEEAVRSLPLSKIVELAKEWRDEAQRYDEASSALLSNRAGASIAHEKQRLRDAYQRCADDLETAMRSLLPVEASQSQTCVKCGVEIAKIIEGVNAMFPPPDSGMVDTWRLAEIEREHLERITAVGGSEADRELYVAIERIERISNTHLFYRKKAERQLLISASVEAPPPKFVEKICPFCGENDFDAWGLKFHLSQGGCDVYNETTREKRDGE